MASFLVVPQWQGSGSPRRRQLVDGAAAIRAAIRAGLPAAAVRDVEVPEEAEAPEAAEDVGPAGEGRVHRYRALRAVRERHAQLLADTDGLAITIGGDCGVELAAIGDAVRRAAGDLAIVWFDAHGDLNTPASSPSGAFHGMVLRAALGDGAPGLVAAASAVPRPDQVVLAGTRAFDAEEQAFVATRGVRHLAPAELAPAAVVAAIEATGASSVFIHVDLDVLDPGELAGIGCPEPRGVAASTLLASLAAIRHRFSVIGAGLTEFTPWSADAASGDLATIQRILAALAGERSHRSRADPGAGRG